MNFPDDHYNVYILDYDPEFMKLFYNAIDIDKIESMNIVFDSHANVVECLNNINDEYKDIMIRYKAHKDYYHEDDFIVLEIEDYIG